MDKSPMAENIIVMSRIFLPAQSISRNLWNIAKEYPSKRSAFSIFAVILEVAVSIKILVFCGVSKANFITGKRLNANLYSLLSNLCNSAVSINLALVGFSCLKSLNFSVRNSAINCAYFTSPFFQILVFYIL